MKTNEKKLPRLVCRVVRIWTSFSNSSCTPIPTGFGSSHVQQCAGCQAYFQSENELTQTLGSGALIQRAVGSAGLEQRIIYAAHRAVRAEPPPAKRFNLVPLAGVIASAALLAFILAPQIPLQPSSARPIQAAAEKIITMQEAEQNLRSYLKPPAELLKQNPLQNEVELVYSDAKSAWRFLELNFLPATTEVAPPRQPKDV